MFTSWPNRLVYLINGRCSVTQAMPCSVSWSLVLIRGIQTSSNRVLLFQILTSGCPKGIGTGVIRRALVVEPACLLPTNRIQHSYWWLAPSGRDGVGSCSWLNSCYPTATVDVMLFYSLCFVIVDVTILYDDTMSLHTVAMLKTLFKTI